MPRPDLMAEASEFQAAMDRIKEAQRAEREAKRSLLFQLASELGYSVFPLSEPPAQEAAPPSDTAQDKAGLIFDGTFGSLIDVYRAHEKSPYHNLKHKVRTSYDQMLNRIRKDAGNERIFTWSAESVQKIYDSNWAAGGKVAMGHALVGKLRLLTSFGSVTLNDDACTRLSTILGNMRFPLSEKRTEYLTYDHARAIRATANTAFNWHSIALAQAFKFELSKLRPVDVIGEWVPLSEPGTSDITRGEEKWVGGLRWSDIDENLILRRTVTSGRKNQHKVVEFDLKHHAMIMEEINRVPPWNRKGAIIICEYSNLPWSGPEFRRKWRLVADKAGIPDSLTFSDGGRGNTPETAPRTGSIFD